MANSSSSAARSLGALLAPEVENCGLDLEGVEVMAAGKRRLVRVLVDKDGGVSLDDVALVSQAISGVLDRSSAADTALGGGAYVLEVSSPGVDRPLTEPRHWRRAAGRLVRVPLLSGGEVTGRVVAADVDGVRLAVQSAGAVEASGERALRFDELGPGRVQVEFNRPTSAADDDESESFSNSTSGCVEESQ